MYSLPSYQRKVTEMMNVRKVRPSTSCRDTSNFNDYKINEVQFHHKTPVKGTDLGNVVEGIAMEIKGGVGYAFTGSAKTGWIALCSFTSFGDAKRNFATAKGLTGGSVRNWRLSFQGKRMSIDWPQLRMQETEETMISNLTKTKKRSAATANNTSTISKKKPKAKQDATKAKTDETDANSQEKKGTRDKIPDSTKTKKRNANCAKNSSANSKNEPKANGVAATVNADADAPEKKGTRDNWKVTTFVIAF